MATLAESFLADLEDLSEEEEEELPQEDAEQHEDVSRQYQCILFIFFLESQLIIFIYLLIFPN